MCVCTLMDAWLMMTRVIRHTHMHDCITKYVASLLMTHVWLCNMKPTPAWNIHEEQQICIFSLLSSWFYDLPYVSFSYIFDDTLLVLICNMSSFISD